MDFGLSEEQALLMDMVRRFVSKECPSTRLHQIFDSADGFDPELWRGLIEIGVGGLAIPERYGGAGLELLDLALVAEVLGELAFPGPFLGQALAGIAIALAGSDAQREAWLPRIASGELLATIALGEPGDAWDPAQAMARFHDGKLTGRKSFVPLARRADLIVVTLEGNRLGLVERAAPGVRVEAIDPVDRTRHVDAVTLESAPGELLAEPVAARVRDAGLVLLAADAFGGGWKMVEMSVAYATTREQFGQTIAHLQAVKHRLADMALEVEPGRGLYWYAAHAFDHLPEESERAAALAKAHLTDRFMSVARQAVEIHGGIGFTWECDAQIWFKRALFDRAFLGNPSSQRRRLARRYGWRKD